MTKYQHHYHCSIITKKSTDDEDKEMRVWPKHQHHMHHQSIRLLPIRARIMRTRRAKTDPPGAAIGPSIVLEGEGALVVKTFPLQGQYISILNFTWRFQINAGQNSVTFNVTAIIVRMVIIIPSLS